MLLYGNMSKGFPARQFFTILDEIAQNAFFYRDESNTSIFFIKDATLEITIFFSFLPNLLN
jgi:hypothetical protein